MQTTTESRSTGPTLAPCHSRREIPGETTVFFCAHPQVHIWHQRVTVPICRACSYWQQPAPAEFRPLRLLPDPAVVPCVSLGDHVADEVCPTCTGNVRVKVYRCTHPEHEKTTIGGCRACNDYQPVESSQRAPVNDNLVISRRS